MKIHVKFHFASDETIKTYCGLYLDASTAWVKDRDAFVATCKTCKKIVAERKKSMRRLMK